MKTKGAHLLTFSIDWLEGVLLMASYIIIALAAWFYPNINENQC